MAYEKKREKPVKQVEPEKPKVETYGKYTVTKPADQYVVKLGGSVVYASANREQIDQYLKLVGVVK